MKLRNITEQVVWKNIDQILPTTNNCACERCRLDIASYALNRLPPHYVVSEEGEMISYFDTTNGQNSLDVVTAVVTAMKKVGERPNH